MESACKICDKKFKSIKAVNAHMKIHRNGDLTELMDGDNCGLCGETLRKCEIRGHLIGHMKTEISGKEEVKPELFKFKMLAEPDTFSMVMVGPRRSGKTHLTMSLISWLHYTKPKMEIIILKGSDYDCEYTPFKTIKYSPEVIEEIVEKKRKNPDKELLIVLDDISFDNKSTRYSTAINEIYLNGRHLHTYIITVAHSFKTLDTQCRSNADFVMICDLKTETDFKASYEELNRGRYTKQQFTELITKNCISDMNKKIFTHLCFDTSNNRILFVSLKNA